MKTILNCWLVLAIFIFGAIGCQTTKQKLDPAGVYARWPELHLADSTFSLADSALDGAFLFEQQNRKMLWDLSPNIKHALDKLRDEAWQAEVDYAIARSAYTNAPTLQSSNAVWEVIGRLLSANSAALTVIQSKGTP